MKSMRIKQFAIVAATLAAILAALTAMAQQPPLNSPLLDHLAGKWVMQGTVGKVPTTHEFEAEWVLGHHYLRFHEFSREKNDKGEPQYEAMVFIGWNENIKQYGLTWMDTYGGATVQSIGMATPKENELAFVFRDEHGEIDFTNAFIYDPKTNTWENRLDNVVKGEAKPFACRIASTLTPKRAAMDSSVSPYCTV